MAVIPVVVKHQGKKHEIELDTDSSAELFKFQIFSLTGVEPPRQKIIIKGSQLKDTTDLSKLGIKPGHAFMMMGTPSQEGAADVLERPKEKTKFVEDMTESDLAKQANATPAGLQNLGNTCYLNSTLQTLRTVPELQDELLKYRPSVGGSGAFNRSVDLTASLRDLYRDMSSTIGGYQPLVFLNVLRQTFPQFAQRAKSHNGYAQQDAEEAYSQILSQLKQKLVEGGSSADKSFIDKYFSIRLDSELTCDDPEAAEKGEKPSESTETTYKLDCHIGGATNHLSQGLAEGLEGKIIGKRSPVLEKDCDYTRKSKVARLPKYLTIHFVRFYWKQSSQKKAKIMRKVTFPIELDAVEYCTDDLKKKLIPVRDQLRELRKELQETERAAKRQKKIHEKEEIAAKEAAAKKAQQPVTESAPAAADEDKPMADAPSASDTHYEKEQKEHAESIAKAREHLKELIDKDLSAEEGANATGLYELRALITHQGASADSGHYCSYVKQDPVVDPKTGKKGHDDGNWWFFNDDKVSLVNEEKILALSGGGESHSALICLYRAVSLPADDEAA